MSNYYKIDIKKLVVLNLPTDLRKPKMVAWLHVLVTPLITIYDAFMRKRQYDLYELGHNGQVCYLRSALNDKFDPEKRRIELTGAQRYLPQYIYTEAEQKPVYLGTMYLRQGNDYANSGVNGIVLLPFDVWNEQKTEIEIGKYRFYEIEALIEKYLILGKRYKIELK